jgi:hypothetical protein
MKLVYKILLIFLILTIGFVIFLYSLGSLLGTNCYAIDKCKSCWQFGNETSKYNTLVDILLCACSEAKSKGYSDAEINIQIRDLYKILTNTEATVQDICTGKVPLIKYK